jgi:hypothetical protein
LPLTIGNKLNSCGDCAELPCKTFIDPKDPSLSDEEHRLEIDRRVTRLKII